MSQARGAAGHPRGLPGGGGLPCCSSAPAPSASAHHSRRPGPAAPPWSWSRLRGRGAGERRREQTTKAESPPDRLDRVLPGNPEKNVFSGFVNIFTLQRARGSPSLWTSELCLKHHKQRCNEQCVRGLPPTTPQDGFPDGEPGVGTLEGAVAGWGGFNPRSAWGATRGRLPPARGASPAEKVSCTCSSTISRAMKSCFSLKRPLYSSSAFLSWVANLGGRAHRTMNDPRVEGLQGRRGWGAQGDRPSQSGRQHRPRAAKTLAPGTLSLTSGVDSPGGASR